jgi:hypothetical protein
MPTNAADVPVLLIVFRRPAMARRLVAALREVRPRLVFVAADGPRSDEPDDPQQCADTRSVIDHIDWPCTVQTLFHGENLGCKVGPETAIDWFLSRVPSGIVLEEDCIPAAEFFRFCTELLERYEEDDRVMMIGGHNPITTWPADRPSYVFSRSSPTWGWATWRRAWRHYDPELRAWDSAEVRRALRTRMAPVEFRMASRRFDMVRAGAIEAWDFGWNLAMLRRDGLSVIPAGNMIDNVGFGPGATHTRNPRSPDAGIPLRPVEFPLTHPGSTVPSAEFEAALLAHRFPVHRRILTRLPVGLAGRIRAVGYHLLTGRTGTTDATRRPKVTTGPAAITDNRPTARG